jgi:hypothetical protein
VPNALFATHRRLFLEAFRNGADDGDPGAVCCAEVRSSGMAALFQPETVALVPWPERRSARRPWSS